MPDLKLPGLCVLGELCLEIHGLLSGSLPSRGEVKRSATVDKIEATIGGCGFFGAATAMNIGIPFRLIAHVGSEFPFAAWRPSNLHLFDAILATARDARLIADGESGTFFSFWENGSQARTLYGKPGRGLVGVDLEGMTLGTDRVVLLSQRNPDVYRQVRRAVVDEGLMVICAPNKALDGDSDTLIDYLSWGNILAVSRAEAERYFGPFPEQGIERLGRHRRAAVVITSAGRDITLIDAEGSSRPVKVPREAGVALLGAGDSFATALACSWRHGMSPTEAIVDAAAAVLAVQDQFRPTILEPLPRRL